MAYLGTYKITPNSKEIEVCCYGTVEPAQRETLEQEGLSKYAILEQVECDGNIITDYLSDNLIDYLQAKINEL